MGRRLRYQVAMILDGFIAGPGGEYDWIVGLAYSVPGGVGPAPRIRHIKSAAG